ncbi:MAG: peptidoglycan recognition family protein [Deltaproteobacteria bacterium]|nr:peptidoglycan recognition family protein [Deltaproteobacteria bacterium]
MLSLLASIAALTIVPRAEWDPSPPSSSSLPRRVLSSSSFVVVHHSDFTDQPGPLAIKDYHLRVSGFSDIGYHFVVDKDGVVYEGRALDRVGAHAGVSKEQHKNASLDPDTNSIGVVVDGNFQEDAPPRAQLDALFAVVQMLRVRFRIPGGQVVGHRDVKVRLVEDHGLTFAGHETVCPGEGLWRVLPLVRLFSEPPAPRRPRRSRPRQTGRRQGAGEQRSERTLWYESEQRRQQRRRRPFAAVVRAGRGARPRAGPPASRRRCDRPARWRWSAATASTARRSGPGRRRRSAGTRSRSRW